MCVCVYVRKYMYECMYLGKQYLIGLTRARRQIWDIVHYVLDVFVIYLYQ